MATNEIFPPDFKRYMLKEQLIWSQSQSTLGFSSWVSNVGCVFWSQKDHEIEPPLSPDNCTIPKVGDNIRRALQKLISSVKFIGCLVQFWAPTTTLEGRTLVTTQYRPFALGATSNMKDKQLLCSFRVRMTQGMYKFYADAESSREQLGLPGRVFLSKSPESSPDVMHYSLEEYPQRELAKQCNIHASLAVPVIERSSQNCVGVLEIVSQVPKRRVWIEESFLRIMCDIFQVFGLQCFDGGKICEIQSWESKIGLAFKELKSVLTSVCIIHELPLAMTWVPCSAGNGSLRGQIWLEDGSSMSAEFCECIDCPLSDFLQIRKCSHLAKGLIAERASSPREMLYCSDISQLSIDDYPLVPYARLNKLTCWFTICLQNNYTENDKYILEFFFPSRTKDDGDVQTKLSYILGTMSEGLKNFRLASDRDLEGLMQIDIINFQSGQRVDYVGSIQATRDFSMSDPSSVQSTTASVATYRPDQKIHSVERIQASRDFSVSDQSSGQSSPSVGSTEPVFQDANDVTIKAKYNSMEGEFKLSLPCRLVDLYQKVAELRMVEVGTYFVSYEDCEANGEVTSILCDEDLQGYINYSKSQGNTSHVLLLTKKPDFGGIKKSFIRGSNSSSLFPCSSRRK